MNVIKGVKLIHSGFDIVSNNPERFEAKWQKLLVTVSDEGYDYVGISDPEQEKAIQKIMTELEIPRTNYHLQDTLAKRQEQEIPEKLLTAGYEYDEDNQEYCKSFKTHDVCMDIKGMVSFYVDDDDYDHFMSDQTGRVKRWKQRFWKLGIEMKGVNGVYKQ